MAYESRRSNQGTQRQDRQEQPRRGASSPATTENEAARRGFVRIGGLWKHQKQNGDMFLSGRLGLAVVFVFKQEKKKTNDPDYALFVAPDTAPSERAQGREPGEDL